MKNNVIIVGVLNDRRSTNLSMARAFMRFNYNVIPINYRSIIQRHGHEFFENLVIETVKKYSPVLMIFCKCNGVSPDLVKECTKLTTTWLWQPDPHQTIDQHPEVIEHMKNCTFCSHTGGGVNDYYVRRYHLRDSYHIFCGLDTVQYKPCNATVEFKADISFIGNKTPERDIFYKELEKTGKTVKFYGQGYIKPIYNEEFSQVCSSSKMMLSLNTYNNIPDYFSNRLLRYAVGTCPVHYDPTETINNWFTTDEILTFKNKEELINLVKNTTLEEAGKIALNFREKVLNNYTWEHTVLRILEKVHENSI